MSAQWQYKVVEVSENGLMSLTGVKSITVEAELNKYGAQGWELAYTYEPNTRQAVWLYLKKPK